MEQIVNTIIGLSNEPAQLISTLKPAILDANQAHLIAAVAHLNPQLHSLGGAILLHHLTKGNYLQGNLQRVAEFVEASGAFLTQCSTGVQHIPEAFAALCSKYKDLVIAGGQPRRGILPLSAALRALQPSPEVLTPIHKDLFQLCLLSKCYSTAEAVLQDAIYDVDPPKTGCTPPDLYLYCYYGAMLHIGRRRYALALDLLLTALTAPCLVGNAILLAAYKKYVLVALIHAGKVPPLPKYTSARTKQLVEAECKPYHDLVAAYAKYSADKVERAVDAAAATFTADGNLGLVRLVAGSVVKRCLQRLTQTYLALSLQDIASQVGLSSPAEAEKQLTRMIGAGEITAKLSADGMVRFQEDSAQDAPSPALVARIGACIQRCMDVNDRLHKANAAVSLDTVYLQKVVPKGGGSSGRYDTLGGALAAGGGDSGVPMEDIVGMATGGSILMQP